MDEYQYAEYTDYETEPPPDATSEPPVDEDTPAPSPTASRPQQQQREQNEQGAGSSGRRTTGAPPSEQLRGPLPPMVTEPLVNVRHDTSCVLRELLVSPAYLTGIDLRADLSWRLDTGTVHTYTYD